MGTITNPDDLNKMRAASPGRRQGSRLHHPHVKPGVTTGELDRLCLEYLTDELKVKSATVGYAPPGYPPFPGAICTSVNHQVCHGVPGDKVLKTGTPQYRRDHHQGWLVRRHQPDVSRGRTVHPVAPADRRHARVHVERHPAGQNGATLGDIGHAIQKHAEANGFSVVREFCGHGIGQRFHEDPQVLHWQARHGRELVTGMLFTIEPMINAGRREIRQLSDGWTVVTRDHSLSAQWEHAVCVTDTGYEVLTPVAGHATAARLHHRTPRHPRRLTQPPP